MKDIGATAEVSDCGNAVIITMADGRDHVVWHSNIEAAELEKEPEVLSLPKRIGRPPNQPA